MAKKTLKNISKPSKSVYVNVRNEIRNLIDTLKDQQNCKMNTIIEKAIELYSKYLSMDLKTHHIIEKLLPEFEDQFKLFEESVKFYYKKKRKKKKSKLRWWCNARSDMQMMLIGKTDFNQLIAAAEAPEDKLNRPIQKNEAFDLIIWYNKKQIKDLELEEILKSIKKVWVIANYFYKIDVAYVNNDQFLLTFKHHQNKRYSNYWLKYFTEFFKSEDFPFKILIEGEFFEKTLIIKIKKGFEKNERH